MLRFNRRVIKESLPNIFGFPSQVNKVYSVVAACISFWLPAGVMVYVYIR